MPRLFKRPELPQLLSVSELFQREIILSIPKWQREYSWEADEEVRQLLEDLTSFIASNKHNYVLGSIITYLLPDGSHAVVDGQQRTITLYTLIISARDVLEKKLILDFGSISSAPEGFRALYQTINSITRKISLDAHAKITVPINMEYGDGNALLTAMALKEEGALELVSVTQVNIWSAYEKCKDHLDKTYIESSQLGEFIQGVLQGTFLVETNVGDQRQALDIFFKMNSRGKDLEGADYLKNYLFQKVDDDQYDDLSDKWTEMTKALRSADSSRSKLKTPEFFLRNLAIVNNGEKISGDFGVYEYWETKFDEDPNQVNTFLQDLQEKARVFSYIAGNKLIESNAINTNMIGAEFFTGTQYIPVLLAGSHLDKYNYLSELVNGRYLVYILSQERTQDFESMVPRWAKKISELPKSASQKEIDLATRSVPGVQLDQGKLLGLENRLLDLNSPKDDRRIRLVLATASLTFENGLCELGEFLKKYRPNKHTGFDLDLILNRDEIALMAGKSDSKYFFGIGNLTLVNGQAKHYANKQPQAKEELYGNDKGVLTRSLSSAQRSGDRTLNEICRDIRDDFAADLNDWDENQIEERSRFIIQRFIHSLPTVLLP
jgi:hypothetical protein